MGANTLTAHTYFGRTGNLSGEAVDVSTSSGTRKRSAGGSGRQSTIEDAWQCNETHVRALET